MIIIVVVKVQLDHLLVVQLDHHLLHCHHPLQIDQVKIQGNEVINQLSL